MSDDRPQYGEYATPEEQRRAAGLPATPPPAAPAAPAPAPQPVPLQTDEAPKARPVDRLLTIAMLAYGLVNVLSSIPQFLNMGDSLTQAMKVLGIPGEFTNLGPARTWGVVAVVVMLAGFAATVYVAFRRIRAAKPAWWVPLAGFALTMVVVSLCLMVPIMGDPAFLNASLG
ncbi:hypothetical protein DY023_03510 [Microbacterium bovistercoris]|uniref:Uncharacterized protein n=1 Tax=Microbacterium bovistercoris TaxID=2293570 RepID=A0A371NYC0_9MICO|nr:DUF6264 family protein [Microbacterium bovistercoris]REJ07708.1 hypothetical protein DY023_03510 [Microbacterium bovistercoris]